MASRAIRSAQAVQDAPGADGRPQAGDASLLQFWRVDVELQGKPILRDVDLSIGKGEIVCVVGPSGSGKTTMLRTLSGFTPPTSGRVLFDGQDIRKPRQDIAIVFQDYGRALLPWRNAARNVELAMEAGNTPRAGRAAEIQRLLSLMGLAAHADKYPGQMSGGMQQRLQIARCLAQTPAVILMDEPFGALDAMTRQTLQDEVLKLVQSMNTTVFFVTHDLDEAIYLADRVVALLPNPGRIGQIFDVDLPYPRDQISTREHPTFLKLRRQLFNYVKSAEQ
ncbi:ABC transporter ATP-binding protein [Rhodopseudomonas palustris]|uniref:ABC transporter ATP-binding protein n=1 Tax=Rhodopseudomonas palustris TaxID=1076 RepID=A0A418VFY5_RHOPL|nr:ABC transporter ATP-binding protein [Rhodopseudomonas palustris]RJF75045.1 ABC transporter ATP-binding protein [Rhodopseudomonas palustris]